MNDPAQSRPVPGMPGFSAGSADADAEAALHGNKPQEMFQPALTDAALLRTNAELIKRVGELETANAELQSFAGTVAHDLRTPLGHIESFAELLVEGDHGLDDEGYRHAETIMRATRRMSRLIGDLLDLSRVQSAPLKRESVDLSRLVARLRSDLAGEAAAQRVVWKIDPLPTVCGDAALLRVAFEQLLDNAVKFSASRDAPQIDVTACDDDAGGRVIRVRDNGIGYDPLYASRLFQPLQKLHPASRFSGSGVGLAMVRCIATRHGGSVWAESQPDQGAAFYLALPEPGSMTAFQRPEMS